jgi:predicted Zn-ribbon and HTH transcriptional regulator
MCTPLAFETNGTLFNMDHLIQNNKGTHRFNVKKFIDVWARRVALTAKPSQCQKCQCVANEDGVGQIMCSKCLSPSVEHFLKVR